MTEVRRYLVEVERELHLDQGAEEEVLQELYAHLQDRVAELCESGYPQEEAIGKAINWLGPAKSLARKIHEARSGESWGGALLASAPHFMIALTFRLWHNAPWVAAILIPVIATITYGFRKYKPAWLYPWLGYSVLACGSIFVVTGKIITLSSPWYWLMSALFLPLVLWLASSIFVQALRRDWLFASLMLLPFPVTAGWLLAFEKGFSSYQGQPLKELDFGVALSFIALGVTTITFVRLRRRLLQCGLLLTATLAILMLILLARDTSFFLAFLIPGLLLLPALLEPRLKRNMEPAWLKQMT